MTDRLTDKYMVGYVNRKMRQLMNYLISFELKRIYILNDGVLK